MIVIRFVRKRIGRKIALAGVAAGMGAAALGIVLSGEPLDSRSTWVLVAAVTAGVLATALSLRPVVLTPLDRLTGVMKQAEEGDFLKRVSVESDDELGDLASRFNVMLAKITDLLAERIDRERETEQIQRELDLKKELAEKTDTLEGRIRDLILLMDVTRAITSSLELEEVLAKITDMVGGALGFDEFAVLLYDSNTREYEIAAAYGFPEGMEVVGLKFRHDEGIISLMHERRDTVLIQDTSKEPRYLHFKGARKDDGSLLAIPLLYQDRIVGALSFNRPGKNSFDLQEIWLLQAVASQASLAIANARLHRETVELSLTDALTGIANRRDLERRLNMELPRAERFGAPLSIIMADIDHFKAYNDTHGHPLGDEILRTVAEILVESVRSIDTVARYGGEEFTIVLPHIEKEQALEVAEKLREAIGSHEFPYADTQPGGRITFSLGVATFPDDATTIQDILNAADVALYHAKSRGRNRVEGYYAKLADCEEESRGVATC